MKNFTLKTLLMSALLCVGLSARATDITYTFTSKTWEAKVGDTNANWTNGQEGSQLQSGRGVQVTKSATGANATSPISFNDISQVVVTYSTNASSGAGGITIQVGSNAGVEKSVTTTGGTSDRTLVYDFATAQSGNVKLTVDCTTNSIYVKSVKVTYSSGSSQPSTDAPISISLNKTAFGLSESGANGTEQTLTANDITVVAGCKSNASSKTYYDSGHVRFYADSYLKITAPEDYNIIQIDFTADGTWNGSITVNDGEYDNDNKKWTGESSQVDFSFAKQNRISSIAVTLEEISTVAKPTCSPAAGEVPAGETVALILPDGADRIIYTTDGTNPTLENGYEYDEEIIIGTTTTIKAIAIYGEETSTVSGVATFAFTIIPPVAPTFTIGNNAVTANTTVDAGTVLTLSQTNGDADDIIYTTDGTKPSLDNENAERVAVSDGAEITITNTTTVKAIAVDSYNNCSAVASYTFTVTPPAAPTIEFDGEKITITCETQNVTIKYTLDGASPTAAGANVSIYSEPFEITSSCTVKAVAIDNYGNVSNQSSKAVNIIANHSPNTNYFVKVTDATILAEGDNIILVNESASVAMSTTQNSNNRDQETVTIKSEVITDITGNVQKLILQGESGAWYFYTGAGYLYAASSSSNYLKTEETPDNNAKATISITNGDATIIFLGDNTRNSLKYNSTSTLFSCYASGQNAVQIYKEVPTVTIGSTGYATYCTPMAVSFGNDVTAYVVSAVGDDNVTLTEVESVPANTPVVVKAAAAGTYPLTVEASAEAVGDNYLKVSNGSITGDGSTIFALANMDGVGFYAVANGTTIPAGKCYIDGTTETKSRLTFNFESEDATAITAIEAADAIKDGVIYNLSGQRVVKPLKGIYIQNGKKILVK